MTYNAKKIKLNWDTGTHVVQIVCSNLTFSSRYLVRLIESKQVGTITAIVIKDSDDSNLIRMYRGKAIGLFLSTPYQKTSFKPKRKFRDLINNDD